MFDAKVIFFLLLFWHRLQTAVSHKSASNEVATALFVQLRPVAILAAWRKSLGASAVGQTLERTVDPTEAKSLFNHFDVWNAVGAWNLGAISRDPAFLGCLMVDDEPLAQFGTSGVFQQISDLHKSIAYNFSKDNVFGYLNNVLIYKSLTPMVEITYLFPFALLCVLQSI